MSSQDYAEHNHAGRITPIKFEIVPCDDHDYEVCEPCQTALEPAVTEDSDTAVIIRELYKHKIGRSGSNALDDRMCVGGALCNYFDKYIDWGKTSAGLRQGFPHTDTLTDALWQIVKSPRALKSDCRYYATALIEENDAGNYDKAWELVEEFCEEYSL